VGMWSTLYRYNIMPDKEMLEELIKHQLSEKTTFGPAPNEINDIKSEEKVMALLSQITAGFGDSMDFRIVLKEGNREIVSKYASINDRIIFRISDEQPSNIDFTASITLDDLYAVVKRINHIEAQTVQGPPWADTGSKTPMMLMERISLAWDFWNSFTIHPWTAKTRLTLNLRTILNYMMEINDIPVREKELITVLNQKIVDEGKQMAERETTIPVFDEPKTEKPIQTPEETQKPISDDIETLTFKLEISHPGGTTTTHYKARNLQTTKPDLALITPDLTTIILGGEQKVWHKQYGEWVEVTKKQDFNSLWDMYYTNQFTFYHTTIMREGKKEIITHPEEGVTMRIYDLNKNQPIHPDNFKPN
jgi:hypothetical protein